MHGNLLQQQQEMNTTELTEFSACYQTCSPFSSVFKLVGQVLVSYLPSFVVDVPFCGTVKIQQTVSEGGSTIPTLGQHANPWEGRHPHKNLPSFFEVVAIDNGAQNSKF